MPADGCCASPDDEVDLHVPVLGVGDGAGLHDVPVTLVSPVLAGELVTSSINLRGLGKAIGNEGHVDIRAQNFIHGAQLAGDEACAVWTEALVVNI